MVKNKEDAVALCAFSSICVVVADETKELLKVYDGGDTDALEIMTMNLSLLTDCITMCNELLIDGFGVSREEVFTFLSDAQRKATASMNLDTAVGE